MNLDKFKSIFTLLILGIIGFIIHKIVFHFFVPKSYEQDFIYSILLLYLFFFFFSVLLVLLLDKVKQNNINSVGFAFLFLTTMKIVVAFMFLKPILNLNLPKTPSEKMSFFIIFIYFLTIETIVTIRILNNKQ
jgi:hypothetical protein